MPVGDYKINSFLAAIFTGRTVKVSVCVRINLVEYADEIVFHGGFVFRVEIKLAVHGF